MSLAHLLTDPSWMDVLQAEFKEPYFIEMEKSLMHAYDSQRVFPPREELFAALNLTPFNKVKVVIIGQDPYHGEGQAHGLSFSVRKGVRLPPSLVNIFKELEADTGYKAPANGDLSSWAKEGVLLLNNQLSVLEGNPMSHKDIGWNIFTDKIIEVLNEKKENIVFILWGSPAQKKAKKVSHQRHCVLQSVHPSPLSSYRGFFGSKPFTKANAYLQLKNIKPINWNLM